MLYSWRALININVHTYAERTLGSREMSNGDKRLDMGRRMFKPTYFKRIT